MSLRRAVERFKLEEYLERFAPRREGKIERAITCPVCGKADKLIVNLVKRAWHCWYCEGHVPGHGRGGLLALIQLLEGVDRSEAARIILAGAHDWVPPDAIGAYERNVLAEAARVVVPIPPPANWRYGAVDHTGIMPYASRRGISYQDVVDFGLMWCEGGRYNRRLVFPVWEGSNLVYWQARAMWEEQDQGSGRYVKALNPPRQPGAAGATDVVMNLDRARHYPRVAITEGPIDCIHVGLDAVCTFGKRISPVQLQKLVDAGVRAVDLMWDGPTQSEPRGAWPDMFKAAPALRQLFDIRLVFLPRGDPGDYTREELAVIRRDCSRPYSSVHAHLLEV